MSNQPENLIVPPIFNHLGAREWQHNLVLKVGSELSGFARLIFKHAVECKVIVV
jgi:hypothetical protein